MPPYLEWYAGRSAIRGFFGHAWSLYNGFRLLPTAANAQPAFGLYSRRLPSTEFRAHSLQVLTVRGAEIEVVTNFKSSPLFAAFGLPPVLRE